MWLISFYKLFIQQKLICHSSSISYAPHPAPWHIRSGRKQCVSSLQSLVCWYQQHSHSCPHEPQLRALETQSNFSTTAVWQCEGNHSFVQYLFSPLGEASDSEHEEGVNRDSDGECAVKTDVSVAKNIVSWKRRKEAHRQLKGV